MHTKRYLVISLPFLLAFSMALTVVQVNFPRLPPVQTGNMYVSNYGNGTIAVYDSAGAFLRNLTPEGMSGTRGIVFAPNDRMYVASQNTDEIFVFDAETLCFLFVNEGARRNLGNSMEELRTRTPIDIKPAYSASEFDRLLAPLRAGEQRNVVFETHHRRKDGTDYDVEVHVQRAEYDSRDVFAAFILDITHRKRLLLPLPFALASLDAFFLHQAHLQAYHRNAIAFHKKRLSFAPIN